VERLAKRLKIPITTGQINVKELATCLPTGRKKGSLEEIARNARLGFLFRVAREIKTHKIALGHNLDDQAETVLMRILRGTGLLGLSGILPKREIADFEIIRPLIEVRRPDIETFLKRKKIRPRIDASNLEDIYFRNRIRNRLLPLLEKEYNQNIRGILSNMAESVGCDYNYLNRLAEQAMRRVGAKINGSTLLTINPRAQCRRIDLKKFLKLHPAIQRMVLRLAITRVKGDTRRITFQHIKEIEGLILNRPINSIVDLPKGVSVIKKKKYLSFYQR
jgi:tRNA(Ile)-lysidine synthase